MGQRVVMGPLSWPLFSFDETSIERLVCNNSVDVIGNELSTDVLEVNLFSGDDTEAIVALPYMTEIGYYSDDNLAGIYYLSSVDRTGISRCTIKATSLMGALANEDFYGDFYVNKPFKECFYEIISRNTLYGRNYMAYRAATTNGYTRSFQIITGGEIDSAGWDSHVYYEFEQEDVRVGVGVTPPILCGVCGHKNVASGISYYVGTIANRDSDSAPFYLQLQVLYGNDEYLFGDEQRMFGVGSKFVVDVNPVAGTIYVRCDYIKYDDSTVSGTYEKTVEIEQYSYATLPVLNTVFGYRSGSSVGTSVYIKYIKQVVFNSSGAKIFDVCCVKDTSNSHSAYPWMAVDTVSGVGDYFGNGGTEAIVVSDEDYICEISSIGEAGRVISASEAYEVSDDVSDILVNGWLPITTRRDALHHLLFASNANIVKTGSGVAVVSGLSFSDAITVSADDMYDKGSVTVVGKAKKLSVTEHSFSTVSLESTTVYDNSDDDLPSGEYIAAFSSAPVYGAVTGNGITIVSYNCNAAIVSGRGTITGTPYRHSKRLVTANNDAVVNGADVSAQDVALINYVNSDSVMKKLKAYYMADASVTSADIVYHGEMCGDTFEYQTVYQEWLTGIMSKENITASAIIKASCEFVSGFYPPAPGGYKNRLVLTDGQIWDIPASVLSGSEPSVRAILVGKGRPGTDGAAGQDGTLADDSASGTSQSYGKGGAGGAGGVAGNGGDLYQATVDVSSAVKIGCTQSGYNITLTVYDSSDQIIATFVSSSGLPSENGFTDLFTGEVYARKGVDGVSGGDGGDGGMRFRTGTTTETKSDALPGVSVGINPGGRGGATQSESVPTTTGGYWSAYFGGGGGGGASYENVGANGGFNSYTYPVKPYGDSVPKGKGGNGGVGGVVVQNPAYGSGGNGGNGGGGGGGAGLRVVYNAQYVVQSRSSGVPGSGGSGGRGTPGVDGCIVIYY